MLCWLGISRNTVFMPTFPYKCAENKCSKWMKVLLQICCIWVYIVWAIINVLHLLQKKCWKYFCELLFQKYEIKILQLLSGQKFAAGKTCEELRCKKRMKRDIWKHFNRPVKVPACFTFITVPTLYFHSLSPWLNSTPFSTLVLIALQFKEVWWNQASFPPPTESSVAQVCVFTTCAVCMLVCGLSSPCEHNQMCFWSCVCMHVRTVTTMNVAFTSW